MFTYKRIWLILIVLTVALILFVSSFVYNRYLVEQNKDKTIPPSNTILPITNESTIETQEKLEKILLPKAEEIENGVFLLQEGTRELDAPNPEFILYYYKDTKEYQIILLRQPLNDARKNAEEVFMRQMTALDISQEEVCSLFITVGTISSVDLENSGKNFGLSFCPGAKHF